MTRRIVRTITQVGALTAIVLFLVFIADSRYRLLPSSIHSALPNHHAGSVITDVTIATCSSLNPLSSCRLDPDKWHRVEKDLYLQTGWVKSAWLHVQRKKEEELGATDRVVVGVRVGRLDPGVGEKGQGAERWESRPGGVWLLRSSKRHDSDSDKAITAVDVLFGADAVDPRPGWTVVQNSLDLPLPPETPVARLSVRHGRPKGEHREVTPRVRKDGKFKILQWSDAHLSTGTGACRDAIDDQGKEISNCEADPRTLDFLERVLDEEKPDMVVMSGDQVEGPSAADTQTALFKAAAPVIERSIPWAAIFGNHDDEGPLALSRPAQMSLLETLPFSLSHAGPEDIDGVGNYYVEVLAPSPSQHSAITIYLLDSHSLSPDEQHYRGYDWLKPSQIAWFQSTAKGLKKQHAKYSHIHMDMAFIHIPLPEYALTDNVISGGEWREGVSAPGFNSGFYDVLAEEGVVALGCGHDHVNDYCSLKPRAHAPSLKQRTAVAQEEPLPVSPPPPKEPHSAKLNGLGPWMCYAGGSGFGGYGGYGGYHRRVRVWEIDTNAGRMVTWKRVECCGEDTKRKIGELVIVDGGHVVPPS